jgi:hypothetical protein
VRYLTIRRGEEEDAWRTISSTVENLGCKVLRGSAERVGHIVILHVKLAQTKVTEGDVARVIEKDVLGLEITVGRCEIMNRSDRKHPLNRSAHR